MLCSTACGMSGNDGGGRVPTGAATARLEAAAWFLWSAPLGTIRNA